MCTASLFQIGDASTSLVKVHGGFWDVHLGSGSLIASSPHHKFELSPQAKILGESFYASMFASKDISLQADVSWLSVGEKPDLQNLLESPTMSFESTLIHFNVSEAKFQTSRLEIASETVKIDGLNKGSFEISSPAMVHLNISSRALIESGSLLSLNSQGNRASFLAFSEFKVEVNFVLFSLWCCLSRVDVFMTEEKARFFVYCGL